MFGKTPSDSVDGLKSRMMSEEDFHKKLKETRDMYKRIGVHAARRLIFEKLLKKGFSRQDASRISHGRGVKIAVVNSGIDVNHDYIKRRFDLESSGENFVDWTYTPDDERQEFPHYDPSNVSSKISHGTAVAGVLSGRKFGLLRRASLYSIRVCDDREHCEQDALVNGLEEAMNLGFDLVNMSLGQLKYEFAVTDILRSLCEIFGREAVLVASAGNEGAGPSIPASFPNIISVAATRCSKGDENYNTSCQFSNTWPTVDIAAPGDSILCLRLKTEKEALYKGAYTVMCGTSAAAPIITGIMGMAVAYLKARNTMLGEKGKKIDPLELEQMIKDTACKAERKVFHFEHTEEDIEGIFGGYYGFHTLNPNLKARHFTDFSLGAGRVNAEKFVREVLNAYD
jgi:hypothetical protein